MQDHARMEASRFFTTPTYNFFQYHKNHFLVRLVHEIFFVYEIVASSGMVRK